MIVTKAFAKYKKIKPVVYLSLKGENNNNYCIIDDDRHKGKDLIPDDDEIFGKHVSVKGINNIKNLNDDGERSIYYIVGPSGSGKTYFAAQIAAEYLDIYPDNNLLFISSKPPSTEFKKLRPNIINVIDPEKAYYNWIDPETKMKLIPDQPGDFTNSLIVIDDIEAIIDKNVKSSVEDVLNQLLTIGRSQNASILYLKHDGCDHKKTKCILQETNFITVFNQNLSNRSYIYLLQNYAGLDKKQIDYVKSRRCRAMTISLKYPKALITEDEVHIF